jgi:hypothetical protein
MPAASIALMHSQWTSVAAPPAKAKRAGRRKAAMEGEGEALAAFIGRHYEPDGVAETSGKCAENVNLRHSGRSTLQAPGKYVQAAACLPACLHARQQCELTPLADSGLCAGAVPHALHLAVNAQQAGGGCLLVVVLLLRHRRSPGSFR